jgi:hypothetical protein
MSFRDVMCWLGLHWPLRWEQRDSERYEELLCQREECRYRLRRRDPGRGLPLLGVARIRVRVTVTAAEDGEPS